MGISYRLKKIAGMVTPGYVVADIGTDHGYVPLFLLKEGIIPKAIGVDTSRGSIDKAGENAERFGLSDRLDLRCSDGLKDIRPGEAQCIIICGMGGILMERILREGRDAALSAMEIIVSPHRDLELVVKFLEDNGFDIVSDETIEDRKKTYHIIKGVRNDVTVQPSVF